MWEEFQGLKFYIERSLSTPEIELDEFYILRSRNELFAILCLILSTDCWHAIKGCFEQILDYWRWRFDHANGLFTSHMILQFS